MRTIWKYPIKIDDKFDLKLPFGSKPLTVQMQDGKPQMWVLVPNTNEHAINRTFVVLGTGSEIIHATHRLDYINSFQDGDSVWHLFELNLGTVAI